SVELGICHCERYVAVEELCNASCLSSLPLISARMAPDGQLLLKVKGQEQSSVWSREVVDILGPDVHVKTIGNVHFVQFSPDGVFGWILTNQTLIDTFISAEPKTQQERESRRRTDSNNSRDFSNSPPVPRIPNPIACLAANDMLLIQLSINYTDRHLSHFPVYQKDHLFSSNPSWDFGAFRKLEQLIKHSQYNSSRFAHVFTESGKYVFLDNAVSDWSLMVVVSERGTECHPAGSVFQPSSPAQLVRHGIVRQPRLNLLPNWGLITGVLGLLVLLIVVLIITALVLKPNRVGLITQRRPKPKWRSLGEPSIPPGYVYAGGSMDVCDVLGHRGVGEGAEAEEPAVCRGYKNGRVELEEFNVKTLYDKLEDQTLHLVSQLAKHRKDNLEFYRNICQQTDSLKDFLENMDVTKLSQLKELLSLKPGEKEAAKDRSVTLLEATLKAVEGLMYRAEGESWARQDVAAGACPGDVGDCGVHTGYIHGFPDSTQFSSPDMAEPKTLQVTAPHSSVNQQSTAGCLSEQDLSKLMALTPLSKTLQEIQQSLQSLPSAEEGATTKDFIQTLHHAVSALSLALFHSSFTSRINKVLEIKEELTDALAEEFLSVKVPTITGFSEHQLADRSRKFKFFKLQQYLQDRKSNQSQGKVAEPGSETAVKVVSVEQEIDRLNEVFLQLSVGLQGRAEKRAEHGFSSPTQGTVESCLSRHGTLLLDLKRRCVAQRLSEMQTQLPQLSMQQPGSQEPGSQEPGSQGPESQKLDNQEAVGQGPENQKPGNQEAVGQRPDNQKPDNQEAVGQGPDNQKPDNQEAVGQGPDNQKPDNQGPASQKSDNQKPDYQRPENELAEVQKQDSHNLETQLTENIQTPFRTDLDEQKPPVQTFHSQKSEDHKPEILGPNRQTSEGLITEEGGLPAVF
ncbi:hypothetical protein COCON_G00190960, partial [Conger conger]